MDSKSNSSNHKQHNNGNLAKADLKHYVVIIITSLIAFGLSTISFAGTYMFAGQEKSSDPTDLWDINTVVHPTGYTGTGGEITVSVCFDPSGAVANIGSNTLAIENSINNVINTYNSLQVTTENVKTNDQNVSRGALDFESTALHEVGHCLGMGHPNLGVQSGLSGSSTNLTYSTKGPNQVFDPPPNDTLYGNGDDNRDDDVNLHWFRKSDNNPFAIGSIVDSTTYSRDLADLPAGLDYAFATNADRTVAAVDFGLPNTEAVMQQGTTARESQRTLNADDVATLRYAMSGSDEIAGNSDDYTIKLVFNDFATQAPCDITLKFDNATSLAVCRTSAQFISSSSTHMRIISANIFFVNDATTWYFNSTPNATDTIPNDFNFNPLNNVQRSSLITSNTITVTGINAPTAISISKDAYSINGGVFTTVSGKINNLDTVVVRHTSSGNFNTTTESTLTIGGESRVFSSTTEASAVTPNQFTFTTQNNVNPDTLITSNSITVSGITDNTNIIVGGESGSEYSINGGDFTISTGSVRNDDTVVVRHRSSSRLDTPVTTRLTIGETSGRFTSRTTAMDSIPDNFRFNDQAGVALRSTITSNSVTITGLAVPATISVTNGTYSIDGGVFTGNSGSVSNGASIRVQQTSSSAFFTKTNTTLTIGGISDVFTSTTLANTSGGIRGGGGSGSAILLLIFGMLFFRTRRNKPAHC